MGYYILASLSLQNSRKFWKYFNRKSFSLSICICNFIIKFLFFHYSQILKTHPKKLFIFSYFSSSFKKKFINNLKNRKKWKKKNFFRRINGWGHVNDMCLYRNWSSISTSHGKFQFRSENSFTLCFYGLWIRMCNFKPKFSHSSAF